MRIGILSDTHDQIKRTAAAVGRLIAEGAEVLIHCGDLTTPSVVEQCAGLPSYFVFGNNDFDEARLRRAMEAIGGVCLGYGGLIELGGKRIAVTHGDSGARWRGSRALGPIISCRSPSHRERQPRRLDPIHQPWSTPSRITMDGRGSRSRHRSPSYVDNSRRSLTYQNPGP